MFRKVIHMSHGIRKDLDTLNESIRVLCKKRCENDVTFFGCFIVQRYFDIIACIRCGWWKCLFLKFQASTGYITVNVCIFLPVVYVALNLWSVFLNKMFNKYLITFFFNSSNYLRFSFKSACCHFLVYISILVPSIWYDMMWYN